MVKRLRLGQLGGAVALAVGLIAGSSLSAGLLAGGLPGGMQGCPEPLGWIMRALTIQSWSTSDGTEVRWIVWAVWTVGCVAALAVARQRKEDAQTGSVFRVLITFCVVLVALVAVRAVFSTVPVVGLTWTWQLALALMWMLAWYVLAAGLHVGLLARTVGLSMAGVSALSLLCCVQGGQEFPVWPTGNVLLQTTACLAGIFVLGTWACGRLGAARRTGRAGDLLGGLAIASLLVLVTVVLWMAGRRGAIVGIAGGATFLVFVTWKDIVARLGLSAGKARGMIAGLVLAAAVAGGVFAARLFTSGRWETVEYRVAMYRGTLATLWDRPRAFLVGVGPGHLGFALTAWFRPMHSQSPRLFHGQTADHAHSEPLEAVAELGVPLGLAYLALPLGGLIGFGVAYRRGMSREGRGTRGEGTRGRGEGEKGRGLEVGRMSAVATCPEAAASGAGPGERRSAQMERFHGRKQRDHGTQTTRLETDSLAVLGLGAGLAACLAAEATSVGMRYPGVGMLVWGLVGIGWACWAGNGERSTAAVRRRWRVVPGVAAVALSLVLVVLACMSVGASARLYRATYAWDANRSGETAALLDRWPCVPTGGAWMVWKYLQGRASLVLMLEAKTDEAASMWQARSQDALRALTAACPNYRDAPVWLGKAGGDWDRLKGLCRQLVRDDPYEREAHFTLASAPGATAVEEWSSLRQSIRNGCVNRRFAELVRPAVDDPAAQEMLAKWLADAKLALAQPDPSKWPDPLALESVRLAVVVAGQQGKVEEARGLADEAATLVKYLSNDPWLRRLETVEMEVYLDQAWFGWLSRPEQTRACLEGLQERLNEIVLGRGPARTYSEKMAAQFAGMLWLSQGQETQAARMLYVGRPGSSQAMVVRMVGLAYARFLAMAGSRMAGEQKELLSHRGANLLGEEPWRQAVSSADSRKTAPWWLGVLGED